MFSTFVNQLFLDIEDISPVVCVFLLWNHEDKLFASYNQLLFLVPEILEILNRKYKFSETPLDQAPSGSEIIFSIEGILMKRGYL